MKTVKEAWDEYRARVIPKDAPSIQIVETRRGFYAGALSMLDLQSSNLDQINTEDTEADVAMMESLYQECIKFFQGVKLGLY